MKFLVTGAKGQLGTDILKELATRNIQHMGVDIQDFNITDKYAVYKAIESYHPDVVIHCSAYTLVDKAEDEPELCHKINVDGTQYIAEACKQVDAKLLYVSTDYVFSGMGEHFHQPTDQTGAISVYGKTKRLGEKAVIEVLERYFIVRVSWMFGQYGNNFVKTILRLGKEHSVLNVVCDQVGSPTYTTDLASLLCEIAITEKYGIYHATNEGVCSWAEFAEEIIQLVGLNAKVNHIPTTEYPTRATRPLNSRLDKSSLDRMGFRRLRNWQEALSDCIKQLL